MSRPRAFLLDSHSLLWLLDGNPRLSSRHRHRLDGAEAVVVSAASIWELAIKRALGRLTTPPDFVAIIEASSLVSLPVRMEHAELAGSLPLHHRDPFDRMLVAQAMLEGLVLVTADPEMQLYGVPLLTV